ncbi:hypothetical protein [Actinophytocola algeriensis]|uniref:Uncharacterized protein n=1 Tax=Actinophytocola algeriensis TaxID=1768010 RepID=A0A7W7Q0F4_9PSEU|nr:hypothetical protein [Actinophytocola algeriensis]MBB4904511.1 hypothetical protein [Actinophytocola algeriensis]MBE1476630.1 hypothetical protein [Actinophytocola algeriensis]
MTRIRLETAMTPEEERSADLERPARRTVRLAADAAPEAVSGSELPAPRRPATHALRPALRDRVLRVAERVVGDWAPTLREALVRVLVFAVVLAVLGVAFGVEVAAAGAAVGFVMFLIGRRRAGSSD